MSRIQGRELGYLILKVVQPSEVIGVQGMSFLEKKIEVQAFWFLARETRGAVEDRKKALVP